MRNILACQTGHLPSPPVALRRGAPGKRFIDPHHEQRGTRWAAVAPRARHHSAPPRGAPPTRLERSLTAGLYPAVTSGWSITQSQVPSGCR